MRTSKFGIGVLTSALLIISSAASFAQEAPAPALRRWFEVQTFTLATRYRGVVNSAGVSTASQLQYKDAVQARFNMDRRKRYTLTAGFFSGSSFVSSWNNWGVGTGDFDGKDNYLKQLYGSAKPIDALELQYGGLFVARGETDDLLGFDDDGYLVGERLSVREPGRLYFDEVTATRAAIGPLSTPHLGKRWHLLSHPNYTQLLVSKKLNASAAWSLDFTNQSGADTVRAAVTLRPVKRDQKLRVRVEAYRRTNVQAAGGLVTWAERSFHGVRVQAGYATIDRFYGGWNADRFQSGRRVFALMNMPILGPLSLQVFGTRAVHTPYTIPIKRRFDVVVSYDLLAPLKHAGVF